uniref:VIT1/CCC1 transporter family protein n=1 Tax=uncultured Caulobacter sp. TaxID=158749 RepID=UPI0025D4DF8C|nr:VIT family protein [uncultured Caulobacter sp.]
MRHPGQRHLVQRIGWLRAAVLGANDGIISTSSLVVGIAAAETSGSTVMLTGVAALIAGAISMAAGEYVSVSSQSDVEQSDRARETREHSEAPDAEREELAAIYVKRGLSPELAETVAEQLTRGDAVSAHLRDELGITSELAARPIQAALASAATFCAGAIVPVLMAGLVPRDALVPSLTIGTLALLAILGAVGARAAGANLWRGALRVAFWGALAMGVTAAVGRLFGTTVA